METSKECSSKDITQLARYTVKFRDYDQAQWQRLKSVYVHRNVMALKLLTRAHFNRSYHAIFKHLIGLVRLQNIHATFTNIHVNFNRRLWLKQESLTWILTRLTTKYPQYTHAVVAWTSTRRTTKYSRYFHKYSREFQSTPVTQTRITHVNLDSSDCESSQYYAWVTT
jgi:hypothetical protein